MIIIEGMDNTGKTTLIHQLSQQFKLPSARTGTYPRKVSDILNWHNWASAAPRTLILDRHPAISDLVYGPILRGSTCSTHEIARVAREDHYLVYCCPPFGTVQRSYHEREQMEGTEENLMQIYTEYQKVMLEIAPDFIYDFTNHRALNALVRNITQALGRIQNAQ